MGNSPYTPTQPSVDAITLNYHSVLRFTDLPGAWGGLVSNNQGVGSSFFYGFDLQKNTRLLSRSGACQQTGFPSLSCGA